MMREYPSKEEKTNKSQGNEVGKGQHLKSYTIKTVAGWTVFVISF